VASGLGGRLRPYRAVLASRARSQRAYRTSFALDLGSSALTGLVELAEVWVLFSNVTALGGMRFNQILLVFGLADLAFSMADLSFGHLDTLPDFLRAGTLDALTQPASVWSRPLKLVFGFFFPMAFTAYLPAVTVLGLPGPGWLPAWLGWCAPAAAAWSWLMGLLCWRWGVRHYQGGGG
jgi:ABC-type uncharacterized transport system permease subunit